MFKIFILVLAGFTLNTTFTENSKAFEPGSYESYGNFKASLDISKDDDKKQMQKYINYTETFMEQMDIEDAVKVIGEFILKYPNSEYADEFMWLKGEILKYHLHDYEEYIGVIANLINKYGVVKIEDHKRYPWNNLPFNKIDKNELKAQKNNVLNNIKRINKIKEEIGKEKKKLQHKNRK